MKSNAKRDTLFEIVLCGVLIFLLLLFLNPFHWWMPTMLVMTCLAILFVAFVLFAIFVWKEKAADEREQVHRMLAGRVAFLTGSSILVLGIIVQEMQGKLDKWLVYSLVGMIVAKVVALKYNRKKF